MQRRDAGAVTADRGGSAAAERHRVSRHGDTTHLSFGIRDLDLFRQRGPCERGAA
jgi:hypothetical protein